jgi:hypothetical protein
MINGETRDDFDHFRGIVMRHDAELSHLKGIPELVDQAAKQIGELKMLVGDLRSMVEDWREDSKIVRIAELKGQLELKERLVMFWQRLAAIVVGAGLITTAAILLAKQELHQAQMAVGGAGLLLIGWGLPFFGDRSKANKASLPPPSQT